MLREHYPTDKHFEEILRCVPPLEPELIRIDAYLEDEKLFRMIKKDMAKRYPNTKTTGRKSAPVEVILRMLVVKRLYNYSYEATEKRVRDSLSLRQFCRRRVQHRPYRRLTGAKLQYCRCPCALCGTS